MNRITNLFSYKPMTLLQHLAGNEYSMNDLSMGISEEKKLSINVFTDLEPDDVLAINLLHNYNYSIGNKYKINYIVGEGDAEMKCRKMIRYLYNMNNRSPITTGFIGNIGPYVGTDSDKKYEFEAQEFLPKEKFLEIVEKDKELISTETYYNWWYSPFENMNKEDILNYPFLNKFDTSMLPLTFPGYIANYEEVNKNVNLYLCLKPPRELMELWKNGLIDNSQKNLAIYGSFNLRCLMKEYSKEEILNFLKSFKNCYMYETYYMTNKSSYYNYKIEEKFPPDLKRTVYLWNKSIYDDCLESVKSKIPEWNGKDKLDVEKLDLSEEDKAYVRRNYKVMEAIDKQFMQIVNADCGLVASMLMDDMSKLPVKEVELDFNEFGYTQYEESEGSSIKMFILDKSEDNKFINDQFHIYYKYLK